MSAILHSPVAAPHATTSNSTTRVMATVMLALAPATLYGFWLYGWPAIYLWLVTVGFAVFGEAFCLRLMGRQATPVLLDGSAVLTGWLLAISLPPWAPWWIGAFGGLFATLPLFSPGAPGAIDGLAILLKGLPPALDAVSSATTLGFAKTELSRGVDLLASLPHAPALSWQGQRPGSLGETAAWLIAAGGVAMIFLRIISWHIPLAMLAGIALPAAIANAVDPAHYLGATAHVLSGGAMLGAFFIATDYVTSPNTARGQLLFGAGCGLLTWVIRTFAGYPEGVAFAVLLMNSLTPIIDTYIKPRIYGRDRKGVPLEPVK